LNEDGDRVRKREQVADLELRGGDDALPVQAELEV
jgi:hypothetical protein